MGFESCVGGSAGKPAHSENIGVNVAVLSFAFVVSVAVGIAFGLGPALKSARINPQVSLKQGSRGLTGSHHRAQSILVIVQMALTLILLAGAGLLVRTIRQLWEVNPGFDARHILTFKVGLSPSVTKEVPRARIAYQHLLEHVRKVTGVDVADLIADSVKSAS
jgi:hypothetical protein